MDDPNLFLTWYLNHFTLSSVFSSHVLSPFFRDLLWLHRLQHCQNYLESSKMHFQRERNVFKRPGGKPMKEVQSQKKFKFVLNSLTVLYSRLFTEINLNWSNLPSRTHVFLRLNLSYRIAFNIEEKIEVNYFNIQEGFFSL